MDLSMGEKDYIYKHMGHSEQVNQNVYQAPLAHQQIMVVGKRLQTMGGKCRPILLKFFLYCLNPGVSL